MPIGVRQFVLWSAVALCSCACARSLMAEAAGEIRTPKPSEAPRINGPKVYGVRSGHPFLYRIPCTGARPMHFSASGLPSSLQFDSSSGIISGTAPAAHGEYVLTLNAANAKGRTSRALKIVVGETIGLTPQMGWNGWYTFYDHPNEATFGTLPPR